MAEWSKDYVAAIDPLNLNLGICGRFRINWRPSRTLRWKGEDYRLGRSGSGVWKVSTFKAVALACVG
jgi:hypothetical protein